MEKKGENRNLPEINAGFVLRIMIQFNFERSTRMLLDLSTIVEINKSRVCMQDDT